MRHAAPILVSACLCGECCRYDGAAATMPLFEALLAEGKIVSACPEVLGGLDVPREPCEIRGARVMDKIGRDLTEAFMKGAQETLRIAKKKNATVAVLKERSPSCGVAFVYDGAFKGRLTPGQGATTALLRENGITVYSEETMPDDLFAPPSSTW